MDNKILDLLKLDSDEEAKAEAAFRKWKEENRVFEHQIERFMDGRKEHIQEVMDRCDNIRVVDGNIQYIDQEKIWNTSEPHKQDSEEIRLLREQNELLKKLLSKKQI